MLTTGCGQSEDPSIERKKHAEIMETCASDVKELNKGKSAEPTREIDHNIDIVPGALQFPTLFCYCASLLSKMNEFDIEKNVIEFSGEMQGMGNIDCLMHVKFSKGRFYVYTASVTSHNENNYNVYQLFDCHYNQNNHKMVNFVYFLGNEYGNPLIGAYEYKSNVYSCYYKRSEDDEALQDSHFQELIEEYTSLENEFNSLMNNKAVLDATTSNKCIDAYLESYNYIYQ